MSEVVVVLDGDNILGTGSLKDNRIQTVFVCPDQHGNGLGAKIMHYLETLAQNMGHSKVTLDSSLSSMGFYLKLGYAEIERIQNTQGIETIYMEKFLIQR